MAGTIDPNRPNFAFNISDVEVGDEADAAEAKGAKTKETAAAVTEATPDIIVNTPPPPNLQPPSGGPQPGDGQDPIRADAIGASRRPDPAAVAAMFEDVKIAIMEPAIEMLYAKLMRESGGQKDAIDDQVKQLNAQIVACKKEIVKLEVIMQKIDELMPKFQEFMKQEASANQQCIKPDMSQQEQSFADMLGQELKAAGIDISPDKLDKLVQGLGDAAGTPVAEMLAMWLITTIATADGNMATRDPKLNDPNADISQFDHNNPDNDGRTNPQVVSPQEQTGDANATPPVDDPAAVTVTPDPAQNTTATDPTDPTSTPVEPPPEAIDAGFDTQTFNERINQIADLAAGLVRDDGLFSFAFVGPFGGDAERNQAAVALMFALMPNMSLDGSAPLNPSLADATVNGMDAQGFAFTPDTIAMSLYIFSMPFGTGPAATGIFLKDAIDKQLTDKIDRLTQQVAALQEEVKKLMAAGPELDAEMDRLNAGLKNAIAALHGQRDAAVAEVTELLESGQATIEQVQQAFVTAMTGALEALAAELGDMSNSQSVGAPMIR